VEFWQDKFLTVPFKKTVAGKTTTYTFDKSNAWTWGYTIHCVVPEPSGMIAVGAGFLGIVGLARRRLIKRK
jgi:hypothetical protein